jgi:hypothetical protein
MDTSHLSGSVCACFLAALSATTPASGRCESTLLPGDLYGNTSIIEACFNMIVGITWLADANLEVGNSFGLSFDTDLCTYSGDLSSSHGSSHRVNGQMT